MWARIRSIELLGIAAQAAPAFELEATQYEKRKPPAALLQSPGKKSRANSYATESPRQRGEEEDKSTYEGVLVEIMVAAEALEPAGLQAGGLEGWMEALQRRAVKRAAQSEKATLARVEKTWQELRTFLATIQLKLRDVEVVALENSSTRAMRNPGCTPL